MSETVALNKKRQSKFAKKAAKIKSKVQKGEIKLKDEATPESPKKTRPDRGLIYVGHIPHGFFEKEMRSYFSQFGKITKVRVSRSYKTGKSKGHGFVQFELPEVAEVAAQTMDNYLMFKRRLEVKYIPPEKQTHDVFKGKPWSANHTPHVAAVKRATRQRNTNDDDATHVKKARQKLNKLQKKMQKLKEMGIAYEFQANDVPAGVAPGTPVKKVQKAEKNAKSKLEKVSTPPKKVTLKKGEKIVKSKLGKVKKPTPKKVTLKKSAPAREKVVEKKSASDVDKAPRSKLVDKALKKSVKKAEGVAKIAKKPMKTAAGVAKIAKQPMKNSVGVAKITKKPMKNSVGVAKITKKPMKNSVGVAKITKKPMKNSVGVAKIAKKPMKTSVGVAKIAKKKPVKKAEKVAKNLKKKTSDWKSESEHDVSFDEVPKKKKIMQKNLAISKVKKAPVKKMSDKLKKATMGILDSDLVVKTKKVQKKVVQKKK